MSSFISSVAKAFTPGTRGAVLCCLTSLLVVSASVEPAAGQDDVKAAIAWFDTLGQLDASKAELVKVATGQFWEQHGKQKKGFEPAFLLETNGRFFKVIDLNLEFQWFTKSLSGTQDIAAVWYETADLEKSVNAYLESLKKPIDSDDFGQFLGQRLYDGIAIFVLARVCEKRGLRNQATRLFQKVKEEFAEPRFGRPAREKPKSLRQDLIDRMALNRLLKLVDDFANPKIGRKELLAGFEDVVKHFPEGKEPPANPKEEHFEWDLGRHARTAKSYINVLKKMVKEDEDRARRPFKPGEQRSKKEQIAELIYQLRDQEFPDATGFDPFDASSGPAAELVKLSYEAVPQLIEALVDKRFTRNVIHEGINFYWNVSVMRVGDCAQFIIEQISGRRFEGSKETIRAWWAEFQKKGEKQMLIERVAAGKNDSGIQAKRLINKYPDFALEAIRKGVAGAEADQLKAYLVYISATIKDEKAVDFVRQQLKHPTLEVRLAAARGLNKRGLSDGIAPMIQEWRRSASADSEYDNVDQLIGFLATCGNADAMRALGNELLSRSNRVQRTVIEKVADEEHPQRILVDVANARDELLVEELTNTGRVWGSSGSWGDRDIWNPRVCDIAAHQLFRLWALPDKFDFLTPFYARERNRVDLMNIWRARKGLALLSVPPRNKVNRLPDSAVKPKLDAVLKASNSKDRQRAIKVVERLGLPALPAAREFLAETQADHPAYGDLKHLVLRMACIVNEIETSCNSAKPEENLQRVIDALKGKQLDVSAIASLAVKATSPLPEGVIGFEITIEREGDDSGVRLAISLPKGQRPRGVFNTGKSVQVDGRSTFASGSSSSYGDVQTDYWRDFRVALQKAFELGPETNVSAHTYLDLRK